MISKENRDRKWNKTNYWVYVTIFFTILYRPDMRILVTYNVLFITLSQIRPSNQGLLYGMLFRDLFSGDENHSADLLGLG